MHLITERCTGCGYCILVCPYDALKSNGWVELIPAACTDCNLCVAACPNDCFVPAPATPLKPYRPRVQPAYDVVVIGSGLGGLMAAAALAQAGRRVAVFEQLGFPGGRYTELDYHGAAVTTGAWTSLGPRSHIGRFLAGLGIDLPYVSLADAGLSEQYTIRFPGGRAYSSLFDLLTPTARRAWLKAVVQGQGSRGAGERGGVERRAKGERRGVKGEGQQIHNSQFIPQGYPFGTIHNSQLSSLSAAAYIASFSSDPDLLAVVDALAATASGVGSDDMPASEYLEITMAGRAAGRDFAMPVGGVRAIVQALVQALRRAGGELFLRSPVAQIMVEPPGRAAGVTLADGRLVHSEIVIHNGGSGRFLHLAGSALPADYRARLAGLKGVACAALFCATRRPLFTGAPITITPGCRRVVGVFSPTVLDPGLSKTGLHLADAFFPLASEDRAAELALALADMRDLFLDFDETVAWTVPMFFTGAWPGAESGQTFGQVGDDRLEPATPIQNCFLVGMDVQGSGVAGDLIPLGVQRLLTHIEMM